VRRILDPRRLLLRVARQYEEKPATFDFNAGRFLENDTQAGCPLTYARFFAGFPAPTSDSGHGLFEAARIFVRRGLYPEGQFYARMHQLVGVDWQFKPAVAAKGLRLYADKYFPAKKRQKEPVR
jgi:hypothetical protein